MSYSNYMFKALIGRIRMIRYEWSSERTWIVFANQRMKKGRRQHKTLDIYRHTKCCGGVPFRLLCFYPSRSNVCVGYGTSVIRCESGLNCVSLRWAEPVLVFHLERENASDLVVGIELFQIILSYGNINASHLLEWWWWLFPGLDRSSQPSFGRWSSFISIK